VRVSVLVKAYNHEPFIARAIESVLAQRTEFPYEIVVGEDCSTDRTREVLRGLRDQYPERIRVLLRERNLGNIRNFTDTLRACSGEYVALLDGDDYWTSPRKLQQQVAYLDAHPTFSSCACNAAVVDASGHNAIGTYCPEERSRAIGLRRMLISDPVPTSTVMFRRRLIGEFPAWYDTIMMGDWPLLVLTLRQGDMWYEAQIAAAHRVHAGGLWSGAEPARRRLARIEIYEHLNAELGFAHDRLIRERIARQYLALAEHSAQAGDALRADEYVRRALRACRWSPRALLRRSFLRLLPGVLKLRVQGRRVTDSADPLS
jgi:glycosyltransferase involved in cell wall biosynthesis